MKSVKFLLISALALGACSDDTAAPEFNRAPQFSEEEGVRTVVVFDSESSIPDGGTDAIAAAGGVVTNRIDAIGVAFATFPDLTGVATLRANDLVQSVSVDRMTDFLSGVRIGEVLMEVDGKIEPGDPSDPTKAFRWAYQWNMRQIQADAAWAAGYFGSPSIKVGILDTGVDYTNRELDGRVDLALSTAFSPEPVAVGEHQVMDYHFHGTHVASTVTTKNITVAGVAPNVTIVGIKVLSAAGTGLFEWSIQGIKYAADKGIRIQNMSLGAEVDAEEDAALIEALRRVVQYAESKGSVVIAAAGNDAKNLDDPATGVYVPCEVATFCVSATGPLMQTDFDQPAEYTNYGITAIELAAPGGNASDTKPYVNQDLILGACSTRATRGTLIICRTSGINGYYYAYAAGTSMAAPHVSGAAAMILSQSPSVPVKTLKNKILNSLDDIGAPGPDIYSNGGRLNVYRALTGQ